MNSYRSIISSGIEPLESRIAPATIIVNNLTDVHVNGQTDLRDAIGNSNAGDTITFKLPPGTAPHIISLTGGELSIDHKLTIKGPGANKVIIDAQGNSRIFDIG